ncbi:MAG TPA: alpha-2-macroglobulin family protein, partial [Rhodobacteraceae bacterium]|nr:alpha-2-macroglobulin family protein [Paracoccaceae bacterium]
GTIASLPVGDGWGAGAYVTATLFRPMDAAASRNPARAVGVQWLKLDTSARTIGVRMELPKLFRPGQALKLPVSLAGLAKGEEAYVTVAAVDVGILNLTGYTPPAPESWYFGQRKLGMEIRDIYGRLINGLLGAAGKIRSGSGEDDGSNELTMKGTPPAQKPLSLFSGIVRTGPDGKAMIRLDIPQFNGTLRFMAVAWSRTGVGHASADLTVRDPVVITSSLPRFMAPGDTSRLLLNIVNTDAPAGRYTLTASLPPHLGLDGPEDSWTLELAAGGKADLTIPIRARDQGVGDIRLRLTHASGLEVSQKLTLGVRPAQPPLTRRMVLPLAANGQGNLRLDADMLAGLRPGSAALSLSITRAGRLDLPGLLMGLDRYPYGCTEQTTSRALPLLYLSDVAKLAGLNREKPLDERIRKAIDKVMTRMNSEGGFGLWRADSGDIWLSAYVMEFLTRAREKGFAVPEKGFRLALDNLENSVSYNQEIKDGGDSLAYALYVLARNGRASVGDLRYFADSRLEEFTSPLALAHLGGAFNYTGDKIRTATAFRAALNKLSAGPEDPLREDYGSRLRDVAAVFALAAGINPAPIPLDELTRLLDRRQSEQPYTSTQEKAWLLLAAHALLDDGGTVRLTVNGASHAGNLIRRYGAAELETPIRIGNDGPAPLDAVITVSGTPDRPLPAGGNGLSITRHYYTRDGREVSLDRITQTERLVVVLKVHEEKKVRSRLLVVDRLPAGLEIDNPALMTSASLAGFDWLPKSAGAVHSEFRDDRFVAAMDRNPGSNRDFTLAYMVRAVSPGSFVVPPAVVEDMYRPFTNARTATGRVEVLAGRP